jgi:hypothetical protein
MITTILRRNTNRSSIGTSRAVSLMVCFSLPG